MVGKVILYVSGEASYAHGVIKIPDMREWVHNLISIPSGGNARLDN